jgi:hypothetical protein
MTLDQFIAKTVQPGEPLTAQAWNDIVQAVASLYGYLESTQGTQLRVALANADVDRATARVTAVSGDGRVAEAVRPIAPDVHFVFPALAPGPYTLRVEAPGFTPVTQAVTAPLAAPVEMTLARNGAAMPMVFGQTLEEALAALALANIGVSRIIDVTGRDVAPAKPDPGYRDAPVLMQFPDAGQPVPPDARAQLVVAVSLQAEAAVEVPSLAGLTLDEARKALEGLGLVLGKVATKKNNPQNT